MANLYSEAEDIALAEQLHEYDSDDAPPCRHACCIRLRAEIESLRMMTRHVPQQAQSWIFEDGLGGE